MLFKNTNDINTGLGSAGADQLSLKLQIVFHRVQVPEPIILFRSDVINLYFLKEFNDASLSLYKHLLDCMRHGFLIDGKKRLTKIVFDFRNDAVNRV